ncbi:MAG: CDC48 family AAA ATPase [Thermoplasmatota archaeon]
MNKNQDTIIKVAEARARDVGRGIARLDPIIAEQLSLQPGDVITIEGKQETAALFWPGYPEDAGRGIIRMDGTIRRNAGAGIDDRVHIGKGTAKEAERVNLAPTEELRIVSGEQYLSQILEGRVVTRRDVIELNVMGRKIDLVVTGMSPSSDAVIITRRTTVNLSDKPAKETETTVPRVTYEDIGGLDDAIKQVREMIELPLKYPELFEKIGVEAPKGVLLHGPPGTGKTLIAKAVASETNANFYTLSGPEIMSKYYGQSEENLRQIFNEASENAPAIVFIDEIDSIAPKRGEARGDVERRVVAQLLALMDGLKERGKVVVIGATNRINDLDEALRRPGRFDREIEIGIPDRDGRREILTIHTRGMPVHEDVDLDHFADITHGYSGADIAALSKEAAIRALRRVLPEIDFEEENIPADVLNKIQVTENDFYEAFKAMSPSALREVFIEKPNVTWEDIGGLDEAKQALREGVEWPLLYADVFRHMDAQSPKGILLYGPPGTGKTMLAKAVANESEANFISVKGPEFLSKWVGESEKAVRETFRKARQAAPSIIFFDELDAITPTRGGSTGDSQVTERVISQLLTELDGLEELRDVTVIAATNRPDIIDTALLRPGRFDRLIHVPTPDLEARRRIFHIHTRGKPLTDDVDLDALAEQTEGYTGSDIAAVANEAIMSAIREYVGTHEEIDPEELGQLTVDNKHFEQAIENVKPISDRELQRYRDIAAEFEGR